MCMCACASFRQEGTQLLSHSCSHFFSSPYHNQAFASNHVSAPLMTLKLLSVKSAVTLNWLTPFNSYTWAFGSILLCSMLSWFWSTIYSHFQMNFSLLSLLSQFLLIWLFRLTFFGAYLHQSWHFLCYLYGTFCFPNYFPSLIALPILPSERMSLNSSNKVTSADCASVNTWVRPIKTSFWQLITFKIIVNIYNIDKSTDITRVHLMTFHIHVTEH